MSWPGSTQRKRLKTWPCFPQCACSSSAAAHAPWPAVLLLMRSKLPCHAGICRPEVQECVLQMSPDAAGRYCQADPLCKAFIMKMGGCPVAGCALASAFHLTRNPVQSQCRWNFWRGAQPGHFQAGRQCLGHPVQPHRQVPVCMMGMICLLACDTKERGKNWAPAPAPVAEPLCTSMQAAASKCAHLSTSTGLLYLRDVTDQAPPADGGGTDLSGGAIAGIAVGSSVGALALAAPAAIAVVRRRRCRRLRQLKLAGGPQQLQLLQRRTLVPNGSSSGLTPATASTGMTGNATSKKVSSSDAGSRDQAAHAAAPAAPEAASGLLPAASAGLAPSEGNGAVVPELVQLIASHDAAAAHSGQAPPGVGASPEQAAWLASLPPDLQKFVVDPASFTYCRLPGSEGPVELGSGARWAAGRAAHLLVLRCSEPSFAVCRCPLRAPFPPSSNRLPQLCLLSSPRSGRVLKAVYRGEAVAAKEVDVGGGAANREAFVTVRWP